MWVVALSLGFFGSLHCIGMCGPLSLLSCHSNADKYGFIKSIIYYQIGRILCYSLLGLLIGFVGELLFISHIQKILSIIAGVVLILGFLFSVHIDALLQKSFIGRSISTRVSAYTEKYLFELKGTSPWVVGFLNGLLPCGLVYLALIGALSAEHYWQGAVFMFFFGLGTAPAMFGFVKSVGHLPFRIKKYFKKALPIVSLCFGFFMIYRGIVLEAPANLIFLEALKHPIMCH